MKSTITNGRVYDPLIARFLSPDIFVQGAGSSQGYNSYSYVQNNPLMFIDPSGWRQYARSLYGRPYAYKEFEMASPQGGGIPSFGANMMQFINSGSSFIHNPTAGTMGYSYDYGVYYDKATGNRVDHNTAISGQANYFRTPLVDVREFGISYSDAFSYAYRYVGNTVINSITNRGAHQITIIGNENWKQFNWDIGLMQGGSYSESFLTSDAMFGASQDQSQGVLTAGPGGIRTQSDVITDMVDYLRTSGPEPWRLSDLDFSLAGGKFNGWGREYRGSYNYEGTPIEIRMRLTNSALKGGLIESYGRDGHGNPYITNEPHLRQWHWHTFYMYKNNEVTNVPMLQFRIDMDNPAYGQFINFFR